MEKRSLRDKYLFDVSFTDGDVVGVAEVKMQEGRAVSYWWLSGLTADNRMSLLVQVQIGVSGATGIEAEQNAYQFVKPLVAIAKTSAQSGGIRAELMLPEVSKRQSFALGNLVLIEKLGLLGDGKSEIYVRTAREYQLCESFGVTNSVETLSAFEEVPTTTIRKRIERARELGLLERRREKKVN